MSNFQIKTKNQFKEITRYLQEKLSKEFNQDVKLSIIQEAVSRLMGYTDMQHYICNIGDETLKIAYLKDK